MDISEHSSLVAGLVGAVAGSLFTYVGAWWLTNRKSNHDRRARLYAMEHELRGNQTEIGAALKGTPIVNELGRATWDKIHIDLALDVPKEGYERLQVFYWTFGRSTEAYDAVLKNTATDEQKKWLADTVDAIRTCQAFVAIELHVVWKIALLFRWVAARLRSLSKREQPTSLRQDRLAEGGQEVLASRGRR